MFLLQESTTSRTANTNELRMVAQPVKFSLIPVLTLFFLVALEAPGSSQEPGRLLFIRQGDIFVIDELSQRLSRLTKSGQVWSFTVSPDKKWVYYLEKGDIWKMDSKGKRKFPISRTKGNISAFGFDLSPDGKYLAYDLIVEYVACCGHEEKDHPVTDLWLTKSDGTAQRKVNWPPPKERYGENVFENIVLESWYPDSQRLLARGVGILETDNNYWEVNILTNEIKKFDLYGSYPTGLMPNIHFSPTGDKIAYTPTDTDDIWIMDIDGGNKRKVFTARGFLSWVTFSPDGKYLAAQMNNKEAGESLIIFDLNGTIIYEEKSAKKGVGFANLEWSKNSRFVASRHYSSSGEKRADKLAVTDLLTKRTRFFSAQPKIFGFKFLENGRLYYVVSSSDPKERDKTMPQVWVVDPRNWENKRALNNALLPEWVPRGK